MTINAMQKEKGGWGRKDRGRREEGEAGRRGGESEEGRRDGVKGVGRWKG